MDKELTIMIISIIAIILGSMYLGYTLGKSDFDIKSGIGLANSNCSGMDLLTTSKCLNNELKGFYYYNTSNIGKELTEQQLRTEGGVCSSASKWYIDNAKNLGYYAKTVEMFINKTMKHEIAIISGQDNLGDHYCILDQNKIVGCVDLK